MLHVSRLKLRNYCQFEDEEFEFQPGMTAIVGPNGSGKSNVLGAIQGALTGKFDTAPGVKADNVRLGTRENESAYVELGLVWPEGTASIRRSFRPAGQQLTTQGKAGVLQYSGEPTKARTTVAEIEAELTGLLGMPPAVFSEFVFSEQWGLFRAIEMSDSARSTLLGKLFRLDDAERCYRVTGEHLNSLEYYAPIDVGAIEKQRDDVLLELGRLATERQAFADNLEQQVTELYTRLAAARDAVTLQGQIATEESRLEILAERVRIAAEQCSRWTNVAENVKITAAELLKVQAGKDGHQAALAAWKKRETLNKEIASLQKTLGELRQPELTASWTEQDELGLAEKRAAERRQKSIVLAGESGKATCETCGQSLEAIAEDIEWNREKLAGITAEIKDAAEERNKAQAQTRQLAAYQLQVDSLNLQIAKRQSAYAEISAPAEHPGDSADLAQTVAACQAAYDCALVNREQAETDEREQYSAVTTFASCEDSLAAMQRTLAEKVKLAAGTVAELEARAQDCTALVARRARVFERIDMLQTRLTELERSVNDAKAHNQRGQRLRDWSAIPTRIREVMSREGLPRLLLRDNLNRLVGRINDELSACGINFQVEMAEDLSFIARFHDGRAHTAKRLSGGEKVMLALAWRLVLHADFAEDVGILCLDEPTAGLDVGRLACVRQLLTRLRGWASKCGLQCIVVTHDRELLPFFDRTIELTAPG